MSAKNVSNGKFEQHGNPNVRAHSSNLAEQGMDGIRYPFSYADQTIPNPMPTTALLDLSNSKYAYGVVFTDKDSEPQDILRGQVVIPEVASSTVKAWAIASPSSSPC